MNRWQWLIGMAVVLVLVVLPTFPGRANHDTDSMVQDMAAGVYTDWWSPLLMMAWRPWYELGFGIGFVQIGQTGVIYGAVGSLLRPLVTSRWRAVGATILVCIFPTTYAMLINVIRDTWFTAAIVGTVAVIYRTRRPTPVHGALLAIGLAAIVAARQNGVLVIVVLAAAASTHWGLIRVDRRSRRAALAGAIGVSVGLAFVVIAQGAARFAGVKSTGPETATFYVDLDEMSTRVGSMLVPDVYVRDQLTLEDLEVDRNYSADGVKPLVNLRLPPEDRGVAAAAWRDAVTEYPWVYFQSRWQMFTRQIGWSGAPAEAHYPTVGTSRLFEPWSVRLSSLSTSYLEMFDGGDWSKGGFLHRPWPYLIVAAMAGLRFGRHWPVLWCIPAVQWAVLASLFVLAPVSKTRLVYPVLLLGVIAGAYLLLGTRHLLERRLAEFGNDPPVT